MAFKLSSQLIGHESDVRAVYYATAETVLTASRDGSVRRWDKIPQTNNFESNVISQGPSYVNAVSYIKPSEQYPDGLVVSGGKDAIIEVRSPKSNPTDHAERLLIGHASNICTLDVSPNGDFIVSGGWDFQVRVWSTKKWETEIMLLDHEFSVWAVLAFDEKTVITGCADKRIRIFDLTKAVDGTLRPASTIYTPDIVRGLFKLPVGHESGADFACSSNDGSIRLYKLNGQGMAELLGHDSYVYTVAALPTGELVSAGEDRTARIWKGTECIQTITHPALSVWSVSVCSETGDIVTGASDHVARVFTRSTERLADAETSRLFEEAVKASAIPRQQMDSINSDKVPGEEFLKTKSGTKDGQVQVVKHADGSLAAYTWSSILRKWEHVGAVVDSSGGGGGASPPRKTEYNGKEYDYVFDVDFDDTKPPLKLAYNISDNGFVAARKFLEDNELPLTYLDKIVKFLDENTHGASSRPIPPEADTQAMDVDSNEPPKNPTAKHLPQQSYVNLLNGKFDNMINKIHLTNKTMVSAGRKDKALNPTEEQALADLRPCIEGTVPIDPTDLQTVIKVATEWDYTEILPGLDMLRFLVRYPAAVEYVTSSGETVVDVVIKAAMNPPSGQAVNTSCVVMALRTLANLFVSEAGEALMEIESEKAITVLEKVVGISGESIGITNRHVQIAATTLAINLSVLDGKLPLASSLKERVVVVLGKILEANSDDEVLYRALVALGTLVGAGKAGKGIDWKKWVANTKEKASEGRVKYLASECLEE